MKKTEIYSRILQIISEAENISIEEKTILAERLKKDIQLTEIRYGYKKKAQKEYDDFIRQEVLNTLSQFKDKALTRKDIQNFNNKISDVYVNRQKLSKILQDLVAEKQIIEVTKMQGKRPPTYKIAEEGLNNETKTP